MNQAVVLKDQVEMRDWELEDLFPDCAEIVPVDRFEHLHHSDQQLVHSVLEPALDYFLYHASILPEFN